MKTNLTPYRFFHIAKIIILLLLLISLTSQGQTVCDFLPPPKESQKSLIAEAVPYFDSNPLAQEVIYFHPYGGIVTSPYWNGGNQIVFAESGMTTANLQSALYRVKEDYWPFWVSVTTDSNRYNAAPANKRSKMVITPTNYFRQGVGGSAYLGSFAYSNDYIVNGWIFPSMLSYDPKYTGEAMSHEAGHTFNLFHQSVYDANCLKIQEYDPGRGFVIGEPRSEIGHAPIMGASYYRNNTTFTYGPDSRGCSSIVSEKDTIRKYLNARPLSDSVIRTDETTTINVIIPSLSEVTFKAQSFGNSDIEMQQGQNIWNNVDTLSASGLTILPPGTYPVNLRGAANQWNRGVGSGGQVAFTAIIKPITVVANSRDSVFYQRNRTKQFSYIVFTLLGQPVKKSYGELGKATDNLPPGTYSIKVLYYNIQILKR